jgi:glycosyltransferase involved in cell wall biosynthesis
MQKPKRIFVIADFKDESPRSIFLEERRLVKGLIRLGHDVQRFSYRNILTQFNPFSGKHFRRFMPRFTKRHADQIMASQIEYYYPDVVLFLTMKYMTPETVLSARETAPNAVFMGRDGDPYPETKPERIAVGKQMDIMIMPSAGSFLETYKVAGVPCCGFIPFSCDPDIQYRHEVNDKWRTDIAFLGTAEHSKLPRDEDRYNLAKRLSEMPNAKVYACFGRPKTQGMECFYAISGAKIALSINIANDVHLYHSDRLANITACGTFELAKRVPGYELLFEDGIHLKYFDTVDEFFEIANWYLKNDKEREKIAIAGMERAHAEFSCEKIAQYMLDLIEEGTYNAPWAEIL